MDIPPHDRGVRPALRARRPDPRTYRRADGDLIRAIRRCPSGRCPWAAACPPLGRFVLGVGIRLRGGAQRGHPHQDRGYGKFRDRPACNNRWSHARREFAIKMEISTRRS